MDFIKQFFLFKEFESFTVSSLDMARYSSIPVAFSCSVYTYTALLEKGECLHVMFCHSEFLGLNRSPIFSCHICLQNKELFYALLFLLMYLLLQVQGLQCCKCWLIDVDSLDLCWRQENSFSVVMLSTVFISIKHITMYYNVLSVCWMRRNLSMTLNGFNQGVIDSLY